MEKMEKWKKEEKRWDENLVWYSNDNSEVINGEFRRMIGNDPWVDSRNRGL